MTRAELLIRFPKASPDFIAANCMEAAHPVPWSMDQIQKLVDAYTSKTNPVNLVKLAKELGRDKHNVCRKARALGLTNPSRPKDFPKPPEYLIPPTAEEVTRRRSDSAKARIKRDGHPRHMLGKHHTPEVCASLSEQSRARPFKPEWTMKMLKTKHAKGILVAPRPNSSWKAGWREISGQKIYARSRWEANYARFLEFQREKKLIQEWQHEPETFWFEAVRRGTRSYLPDFRVADMAGAVVFHEVKGWMDPRSITKLKRMKKYHPAVTVRVIDSKWFKANNRIMSKIIPGWET